MSCDRYLVGGYGGVVVGEALVGVLLVLLVTVLREVLNNKVILIALLAGVLFPGFATMETATDLALLLLWNTWRLILVCT